jgi:S1-C subfamily serine protease
LVATEVYFGIYVADVAQIELRNNGVSYGIKVEAVIPGSPADVYGLKDNDIIFKIDNTNIRRERDLSSFLKNKKPDDLINVHLTQDNVQTTKQVKLTKRDNLIKDLYLFNYIQNPWLFIGINVEPISATLARLLSLETGMVVIDVREHSIASVQGIELGDIIISVNGLPTHNEKTLTEALNRGLQNQPMQFFLWREGKKLTVAVNLTNSITDETTDNSEVFIIGPDLFNDELYSYSKDKVNRLLNKSKTELETDIERLEGEIYKLKQKINGD